MVGASLHYLVTGGTGFIGASLVQSLLLNGQRVVPTALQNAGFESQYPQLDMALENIL